MHASCIAIFTALQCACHIDRNPLKKSTAIGVQRKLTYVVWGILGDPEMKSNFIICTQNQIISAKIAVQMLVYTSSAHEKCVQIPQLGEAGFCISHGIWEFCGIPIMCQEAALMLRHPLVWPARTRCQNRRKRMTKITLLWHMQLTSRVAEGKMRVTACPRP